MRRAVAFVNMRVGPDQFGICPLEQAVVDEANGEFRRHSGQFEEHLVHPEKLEDVTRSGRIGAFVCW